LISIKTNPKTGKKIAIYGKFNATLLYPWKGREKRKSFRHRRQKTLLGEYPNRASIFKLISKKLNE